jgi:hypothetical protein
MQDANREVGMSFTGLQSAIRIMAWVHYGPVSSPGSLSVIKICILEHPSG